MATPRTVDALLKSYPPDVQTVAAAARKQLLRLLPNVEERADASAPVIAYSYGPGYRGMVCTLILSKSGVKVGLVRGGDLEDPHRLLQGSGKVHRYVALGSAADLRRAGVTDLIEQTYAAWQRRTRSA